MKNRLEGKGLPYTKLISLQFIAISLLLFSFFFALRPPDEVFKAFEAYKQAHKKHDFAAELALTSDLSLRKFKEQYGHALYSPRHVVEKLKFADRLVVFATRKCIHQKRFDPSHSDWNSVKEAYVFCHRELKAHFDLVAHMEAVFTLPSGFQVFHVFVSLNEDDRAWFTKAYTAWQLGSRLRIVREDRAWKVDVSQLDQAAARALELHAHAMGETGDSLVYKLLGADDPSTKDQLWAPPKNDFVT